MSDPWISLAGRIEDGVHRLPVRVYFEDTDAGGVVYHSNYIKFCERGRTDLLRVIGIKQSLFQDMNFVVRRLSCEFLKPARLDDVLIIETRVGEEKGARVLLDQRVVCEGVPLFTMNITVALIDGKGRPQRIPPDFAKRFAGAA